MKTTKPFETVFVEKKKKNLPRETEKDNLAVMKVTQILDTTVLWYIKKHYNIY